MAAVAKLGLALEFASKELKRDRNVVLETVRQNGRALEDANMELEKGQECGAGGSEAERPCPRRCGRKAIVLEATIMDPKALGYAVEELRADREFLLHLVKTTRCWWIPHFAEKSDLRRDAEFLQRCRTAAGKGLVFAYYESSAASRPCASVSPALSRAMLPGHQMIEDWVMLWDPSELFLSTTAKILIGGALRSLTQ